jgi:hypothetical protein
MDLGDHFLARNPEGFLKFIDEKTLSDEVMFLTSQEVLWPKKYEIRIKHWQSSIQAFSDNCEFFFNKTNKIEAMKSLFLRNTVSIQGENSKVLNDPIQQIESIIQNLNAIRNISKGPH